MQLIVKPDIVANCSSAIDLKCIDLDDKNVIMKPKDMNIGFGTRNVITELKRKDVITNTQTANFFTDVTKFIISMVKKLFDKSPLEYNVVRNSVIFNPQVLVNENASVLQNKLKRLLTHLMKLKILTSVQCDKITKQFIDFTDFQLKLYAEKFCCFDSSTKDLDEFYFNEIDLQSFKELSFLMKIILSLGHCQASVERSFSVNNTVINVNMSEDSIVAKKIIKDHMISNKLTPESVQINNKLLRSVSTARQKYGDQLAENKKTKNQECIENQKHILLDEIREVMAKRDELQKTCKSLEAEYVASVTLVEKEMNMSHVIKANALKRRCLEIESEVTKLDETVLLLEEKKRKLK